MVVGVNGLEDNGRENWQLKIQGAKVVVGAYDTFQVAAVDQLQVWCDRARLRMVRAKRECSQWC